MGVIIGEEPYRFLPKEYGIPSCIAGFDGLEILSAIANILEQRESGNIVVGNTYHSVVMQKGPCSPSYDRGSTRKYAMMYGVVLV